MRMLRLMPERLTENATSKTRRLSPSFRGDARHRTTMCTCTSENLEIPRCAIAHLRSGAAHHPGMTPNIMGCISSQTLRGPGPGRVRSSRRAIRSLHRRGSASAAVSSARSLARLSDSRWSRIWWPPGQEGSPASRRAGCGRDKSPTGDAARCRWGHKTPVRPVRQRSATSRSPAV